MYDILCPHVLSAQKINRHKSHPLKPPEAAPCSSRPHSTPCPLKFSAEQCANGETWIQIATSMRICGPRLGPLGPSICRLAALLVGLCHFCQINPILVPNQGELKWYMIRSTEYMGSNYMCCSTHGLLCQRIRHAAGLARSYA